MKTLSRVRLLATPWAVAYQTPPSMGFPRQEYWSGVPLPSPFTGLLFIKLTSAGSILELPKVLRLQNTEKILYLFSGNRESCYTTKRDLSYY